MGAEERNVSKRWYKLTLGALKIIPMLLAFCAALNMLFDFYGINSFAISIIGGMSILPLLFLYLFSIVFRFCAYHRMFLHYILVNNILVWLDYLVGIPVSDGMLLMIHMSIVCVFLFLILYFYRKEKCCKR